MIYALVQDAAITQVGALPKLWWDGTRWHDWRTATPASNPADYGWLPVTETPRPDDTATTTWDRADPDLVDGIPTIGWVERDKTAEELAAQADAAAYEAQRILVKAIITDLRAEKARAQVVLDATNATINNSPAPYIKDTARAAKRIADAAIDLARYVAP